MAGLLPKMRVMLPVMHGSPVRLYELEIVAQRECDRLAASRGLKAGKVKFLRKLEPNFEDQNGRLMDQYVFDADTEDTD